MIQLKTRERDGSMRVRTAGPAATLDDVLAVMEAEVYGGDTDYAAVLVDGKIYTELEV